jgi:hypothetical protein
MIMKKYNYIFIVSMACVFLMSACRARFYTPNRNPVPLFQDAGDLYVDASTNLVNKYDLTAGYALTKNIGAYAGYAGSALKTTYTYTDSNNTTTSTTNEQKRYNGDMLNLGIGYFLNKAESSQFRFEVFGDLALGNYRNSYNSNGKNVFLNGNFTRIGIMPNVGYVSSDNKFAVAYSIRASQIMFSNTRCNDFSFWQTDLDRLNSKLNYTMLEHALLFRAGGNNVKFQMQLAMYHGLNSTELVNAIPVFNASIMVGLVINANLLENRN